MEPIYEQLLKNIEIVKREHPEYTKDQIISAMLYLIFNVKPCGR
jgi:hypothetical protein